MVARLAHHCDVGVKRQPEVKDHTERFQLCAFVWLGSVCAARYRLALYKVLLLQ